MAVSNKHILKLGKTNRTYRRKVVLHEASIAYTGGPQNTTMVSSVLGLIAIATEALWTSRTDVSRVGT